MISSQKNYTLYIVLIGVSALLLSSLVLVLGPKKSLFAVAGLFATFFIFKNPRVGLALMVIAVMNFQNIGRFSHGSLLFMSAAKVLGGLTVAAWLFHILTHRMSFVFTRHIGWGLGLILVCMFSIIFAEDRAIAFTELTKFVTNFILFFLVVNLLVTKTHQTNFLFILLLTGFIASTVAIIQTKVPSFQFSGESSMVDFGASEGGITDSQELKSGSFVRPTGTLGHPNWLSLFLVSLLPLTLYAIKTHSLKKWRYLFLLVLASQLVAMMLTHDRMAFLGVAFVTGLVIWFRLVPVTSLLAVTLCAGLLVLPLVLPSTYLERVFSIDNFKKSDSIRTRWEYLVHGMDMFKNHWATGVGIGNFGRTFIRDYPTTKMTQIYNYLTEKKDSTFTTYNVAAHNLYVHLASETGIMGITVYLILFFGTVRDLYRLQRKNQFNELGQFPKALMISLLGFALLGFLLHAQTQKILWILLGLSAAHLNWYKNQHPQST